MATCSQHVQQAFPLFSYKAKEMRLVPTRLVFRCAMKRNFKCPCLIFVCPLLIHNENQKRCSAVLSDQFNERGPYLISPTVPMVLLSLRPPSHPRTPLRGGAVCCLSPDSVSLFGHVSVCLFHAAAAQRHLCAVHSRGGQGD